MEQFLESQGKNLEDQFFLKEDQKLLDKLRQLKKMQESKESLEKVSGIQNDQILETLVSLNIRPETLGPLSLIPLLEVAWADESLDEKEKKAVISAVKQTGRAKNPEDQALLEQWLERRPEPGLLKAWIHYIKGLCEKLTPDERRELKEELMPHTRSIAEASGGFLGLGRKISSAESDMIKKLESAFEL
jgi:hypothetical protein